MTIPHRTILTLAAVALAALATPAPGAQGQGSLDVTLRLRGALQRTNETYADLELNLLQRDGQWQDVVMGWAGGEFVGGAWLSDRAYNHMDHEGRIVEVRDDGEQVHMVVEMTIHPDPWVPGGPARYTLELRRDGLSYAGTYTGEFRGHVVRGRLNGTRRADPWPAPVPGVRPFEPGEHPRLIFRRDDISALRERMATPQGQAMVARLRLLLGGGEELPTRLQTARSAYDRSAALPTGGYTLWHGMGFGMLYQLTGEQRYADLARQAVEIARRGVRDRDPRYSYVRPGGKLRAGSSFAAIAMAYDLCYDAWPEEYRRQIARELQDKVFARAGSQFTREQAMAEPVDGDLVFNTLGGQHSPMSNHYMAWNGGGGAVILAIMGDPGTDDEITARAHRVFLQRAKRALEASYGTRAYFFEGHHCGRLSTNTGFSSYLQAMRVGLGQDLIGPSEAGQWLVTKWIYEVFRYDGGLHNRQRGMYAGSFGRAGQSSGGDFSQGFGIAPAAHHPAILWFYRQILEPGECTYDALVWPHRAVYAFVNWPLDVEPVDPMTALGPVLYDEQADYWVIRSGWRGNDDVGITMRRDCLGIGRNMPERVSFRPPPGGKVLHSEHDSGVAAFRLAYDRDDNAGTSHLAADATGLSGAKLLVVWTQVETRSARAAARPGNTDQLPPWLQRAVEESRPREQDSVALPHATGRQFHIDGRTFHILAMHDGEELTATAIGEPGERKILLGGRTIAFDGERLVLGAAD